MPHALDPALPTPSYDLIVDVGPSASAYLWPGPTAALAFPTAPPSVPVSKEVIFVYPDGIRQDDASKSPWHHDPLRTVKGKQRLRNDRESDEPGTSRIRAKRDPSLAVLRSEHFAPPSRKQGRAVLYPSCDDEGNNVLACYPTANTVVYQNQWTKFIWNSRIPDFIGLPGSIDVYLYHADSGALVEKWIDVPNVQGEIDVVANDTFWDYRMDQWQPGEQIPYTYYFVAVKSGTSLTGGESRLATWTAVQTAFANSVYAASTSAASVASVSSTSALASLSALGPASLSMFSVSSQSVASALSKQTGDASGSLQGTPGNRSDTFPAWAIALLVVLGVLAFASMAGLLYLLIQNWRTRNRRLSTLTHRESMGSSSPMMAQVVAPNEASGAAPSPPPNYGARLLPAAGGGKSGVRQGGSMVNDGSLSDALISGQDAAIMADAFRQALRKPDFAGRPVEEGESPDTNPTNGTNGVKSDDRPDPLGSVLAEEGNNLRNVRSARGVTVEYPSDDGGNGAQARQ